MPTLHAEAPTESELRWPDFYTVLRVAPDSDETTVKKAILSLYEQAAAHADHRDLSKRFYSQVLREKVLPQCKRILLDPQYRAAYNEQLRLHRAGAAGALPFTEFVIEVTKTQHVSTAFTYTSAETAVLPGIKTVATTRGASTPVSTNPVPTGAVQTTQTTETVRMRMSSAPAPASVASVMPEKPKNVPLLIGGGVGVMAILGILAMLLGAGTKTNLIADSGFESGELGAWQRYGSPAKVVAENARSGKYAVRIETKSGVNLVVQNLSPNTPYTFRAWTKTSPGAQARLSVESYGGESKSVLVDSGDYKLLEIPFTTGPTSTSASLVFWKDWGDGIAYGDDFELTR